MTPTADAILTLRLQQYMHGEAIIHPSYLQHVIRKEEGLPPQAAFFLYLSLSLSHSQMHIHHTVLFQSCLVSRCISVCEVILSFLSILQLGCSD